MSPRWLLEILRIPVVVGLLMAAGRLMESAAQGVTRLQIEEARSSWVAPALLATAAAVAMLVARDRRHHPVTLALELVVAGAVGFVPPVQWIVWFGLDSFVGPAVMHAGPVGFLPPLGIAWFVTVVLTAIRQSRRTSDPRPGPPAAEHP